MSRWDDYHYVARPNPKANRPRTKDRPQYHDALLARIITVDRGRYTGLVDEGKDTERLLIAARARELSKEAIVVGDIVHLVGDTSGKKGSLARLVKIQKRRNVLRRSGDDTDQQERILVANIDYMIIVTSTTNPEPRTGLIDRIIVAALAAGIKPYLCVTKVDLASATTLHAYYEPLEITLVESAMKEHTLDEKTVKEIHHLLQGKVSVLIGHSGVGKSTLVNALTGANRLTGKVNEVTGRGRHTSSSAIALQLPHGGWIIDTPGIRSFGLAHVTPGQILEGFEDLVEATASCEKGCLHTCEAKNCGIDHLLKQYPYDQQLLGRVNSLRRLLKNFTKTSSAPQSKHKSKNL